MSVPSKEERERMRRAKQVSYGWREQYCADVAALLDALEAAEADRDDCLRRYGELYEERGRIVAAEAERDRLREACKQAAEMPGKDWLQAQLLLIAALDASTD